ncbi:mitochondrial inner membrane protease subunit 2 isoform X2 [Rhipicephalus sanguineus]|uniref:mitochondrial inner membrane protease subunit 2 isoform X2 n=1 Tax=Rhipicephalus sanguineus TaxID=34632 RepID=UPI0018944486|nr:mitochondrial inner membrane protease subunit 2 isoform X2 [Rhipicephalus sanguineus]
MWRQRLLLVLRRAAFGFPVAVAFVDCVAYVAKVEGVSMQPELNPVPEEFSDYVLLNRWASRSCEVQRGEVVAIKDNACFDIRSVAARSVFHVFSSTASLQGRQETPVLENGNKLFAYTDFLHPSTMSSTSSAYTRGL